MISTTGSTTVLYFNHWGVHEAGESASVGRKTENSHGELTALSIFYTVEPEFQCIGRLSPKILSRMTRKSRS